MDAQSATRSRATERDAIARDRGGRVEMRFVSAGPVAAVTREDAARDAVDDDACEHVFDFLDVLEPLQHLRYCSSCRKTKDAMRDFTGDLKTCRFCLHDRKRNGKKRRLEARIARAVAERRGDARAAE